MCLLCEMRVGRPVTVMLDRKTIEVILCLHCVDSMGTVGALTKLVIASRLERLSVHKTD